MLRRNPTLIPMGDFDVQDARDLLAKTKEEAQQQQQQVLRKLRELKESQATDKGSTDQTVPLKTTEARLEKARRLGLQSGMLYLCIIFQATHLRVQQRALNNGNIQKQL
jgi:hypothetical protein